MSKLTYGDKLEIISLTYEIKSLCGQIESNILRRTGTYCPENVGYEEYIRITELVNKLNNIYN